MTFPGVLIILEGNISAGKTTLSRDLANLLDYNVFLEPTITNPYLAQFYADPPKYALVMQLWLLKQRFRTFVSAIQHVISNGKGVILDRSVFSDWVFAEKNRRDGNITEEGFSEYLEIRNKLLSRLPIPQITIYLDVSPQECYRRVHSLRCRDVEVGIPLAYLSGLDDCYKEFLQQMEVKGSKILRINWSNFGNSNNIAQLIKHEVQNLPPNWTDINDLTEFLQSDILVQSVLSEKEDASATLSKEDELLESEKRKFEPKKQLVHTTIIPSSREQITSIAS
eukprot:TRINITY_DN554_c0_g1_i2.p1 TRINITY_DN554_c0_g1~~TRINITY_DN554_c0_g1_i2.p1  ORF type:complete len:281 (+),score=53.82 TRINITY_DN554_c0_g1_i2:352-1194(+)